MPTREDLIEALQSHVPWNQHEAGMLDRLLDFVRAHPDCFSRSLQSGHVTASAWVVDPSRTRALLTHHAKLGLWLQPGGHCDGDPDVLANALREVSEEAGLSRLKPLNEGRIFDVDAHCIPARGSEPAHIHYDVRFLIEADPDEPLRLTEESHDLAWVPLSAIAALNTDQSVLRLVERTRASAPPPPANAGA
jgi:8-oxo-dGTP pyrophosphatase MutT (NUDIX family)